MGEDFVRKTQKSYVRAMQEAPPKHLGAGPLLETIVADEEEVARYICRLVDGAPMPEVGLRVRLYMRPSLSRIAVITESTVIGIVLDEGANDLRLTFGANPQLCGILDGVVVSTLRNSQVFEVETKVPRRHSDAR